MAQSLQNLLVYFFILKVFCNWIVAKDSPISHQPMPKPEHQYFFIENKGQWHSDVLFLARLGSLDAWITKYGVNYSFYNIEGDLVLNPLHSFPYEIETTCKTVKGHRILMVFANHHPYPTCEGKHQQPGYFNYFIGNDPSKHASNVGLYKEAIVKNVYKGIDLRYYFDKGALRYDYVVHTGADPSQILFKLEGSNKTYLNEKGQLVFETRFGEVSMADLEVYQGRDKKRVGASFVCKEGERWGFELGKYDKSQDLVIDPLVYSTYLGGSGSDGDYFYGINSTTDRFGNSYVVGTTTSLNYDITPGSFDTNYNGGPYDVCISKLNTNGSALIFSTYLGGSDEEYGNSIFIDSQQAVYVTGQTESTNFAVTPSAYQTTFGGGIYADVFVTKLNSSGTALVYSTYIGGIAEDRSYSIVVGNNGNATITGITYRIVGGTTINDYPITLGSYQTTYGGGLTDAYITQLNSSGTNIVYSTLLGGSDEDNGTSIALDDSGNVFVAGFSLSNDFVITNGGVQSFNNGGYDITLTKLNPSGTAVLYSTYLGGNGNEIAYHNCLKVDSSGNAYIVGQTASTNFDITTGAIQTSYNGGANDIFFTKFNSNETVLLYSTYVGGNGDDRGYSIAIDDSQMVYVTGWTTSSNLTTTSNAHQSIYGGNNDAYVFIFNPLSNAIIYATYFGGSQHDSGFAIDVDDSGFVYVTGRTASANFPITSGAYQTTYGGGSYDLFISKFCLAPSIQSATLTSPPSSTNQTLCLNSSIQNITYFITDTTGLSITGLPPGVTYSFFNDTLTLSGTPTQTGTYNFNIQFVGSCLISNSANGNITIINPSNATSLLTSSPISICYGRDTTIIANTPNATTHLWYDSPNSTTPFASGNTLTITNIVAPDTYFVEAIVSGCTTNRIAFTLSVIHPIAPDSATYSLCFGQSLNLMVVYNGGTIYWYDAPQGGNLFHQGNTYTSPPLTQNTTYFIAAYTNGCISERVPIHINVLPQVPSPLVQDTTLCHPASVTLNAQSPHNILWYDQPVGGSPIASGNNFTTPLLTQTNTYYVEAVDSPCTSVRSPVYVNIFNLPTPTLPNSLTLCENQPLNLSVQAPQGATIQWYDQNLQPISNTNPLTLNNLTQNTQFFVEFIQGNCTSQLASTAIVLLPSPTALANYDSLGDLDYLFHNLSQNAQSYTWYFFTDKGVDSIQTDDTLVVPYTFSQSGDVEIWLVAMNNFGCTDTFKLTLNIPSQMGVLWIPSAFTPNGDAVNDEFFIVSQNIRSISWLLFDRWGNLIFETNDLNYRWDGTFHNKPCPEGVYTYLIHTIDNKQKRKEYKGTITLIR